MNFHDWITLSVPDDIQLCGCSYDGGEWFPCPQHPERCELCGVPVARGSQGVCGDCLPAAEQALPASGVP